LTQQVGFASSLTETDLLAVGAAGLLHDAAITPFGHLLEEAMLYLGGGFDHERLWQQLLVGGRPEVGRLDVQVYLGRLAGLREWADGCFRADSEIRLRQILHAINGVGPLGSCIASEGVDLDNLDNVVRMAFHLGLEVDSGLPVRIAKEMRELTDAGPVFTSSGAELVREWLHVRSRVYRHLMFSKADFAGKLMLIAASVEALKDNQLWGESSWRLADFQFLAALSESRNSFVSETSRRWLLGELWDLSDLYWLDGAVPSYGAVREFGASLSETLRRPCFAYRIKNKMTRVVSLKVERDSVSLGEPGVNWLLGVGSPLRREFSKTELVTIRELARSFFKASISVLPASPEEQGSLF